MISFSRAGRRVRQTGRLGYVIDGSKGARGFVRDARTGWSPRYGNGRRRRGLIKLRALHPNRSFRRSYCYNQAVHGKHVGSDSRLAFIAALRPPFVYALIWPAIGFKYYTAGGETLKMPGSCGEEGLESE